jgi:hypothetical protein
VADIRENQAATQKLNEMCILNDNKNKHDEEKNSKKKINCIVVYPFEA